MKKVIGVIGHGDFLKAAQVMEAINISKRVELRIIPEDRDNPWEKEVQRGIKLTPIPQISNNPSHKSGQELRRERRKNERKNKK